MTKPLTLNEAWEELADKLFASGTHSEGGKQSVRAVFYSGAFAMHRLIMQGAAGLSVEQASAYIDDLLTEARDAVLNTPGQLPRHRHRAGDAAKG